MTWTVSPTFLLRRAGFPFGLLQAFADPELTAAVQVWAAAEDKAERSRAHLLGSAFPAAVAQARQRQDRDGLRALSKARRHVGAGRLPAADLTRRSGLGEDLSGWARDVEAAGRARESVVDRLAERNREDTRLLDKIAADPEVVDALLQLSPDFHDAVVRRRDDPEPGPETAADRAHRRRLYAYLQRLATKNETTSAFGPVTFGRFTAVDRARFGPEERGGVRSRRAFATFWAAAAIGRTATRARSVRDLVPARRLPVVEITGDSASLAGGPPIALTGLARRVLESCDGTADLARTAQALGEPADQVGQALLELERAGLVQRRCEPCSTVFDPLADVLRQVPRTARTAPVLEGAQRFAEAVAEFSAASAGIGAETDERREALRRAEDAFVALCAEPPRRKAGGTYADRMVLFEDCVGDLTPLELPDALARRLAGELGPVLDFGLAVGQRVRAAHRQLATQVLSESRGSGEISLLSFARRMGEAVEDGRLAVLLADAERIRQAYDDLITARAGNGVARLTPAELAELATAEVEPAFVSPDVLLTDDVDGPFVLGESHPYVFAWGLQGAFAPDVPSLTDEVEAMLPVWGGAGRLATVLHRRRHKGLLSERFPGTFIEVTGSAHGARHRVGIDRLTVRTGADGPELLGPDGLLTLYVGEEDHPHLRVFAPAQVEIPRPRAAAAPAEATRATPRVLVGDVVVHRARWELGAEDRFRLATAEGADLLMAVSRLRERTRLTRHLFAITPSETKPLYIDLDSEFGRGALRRVAGLGPVSLSEMMPEPGHTWIQRSAGAFTSELRLSFFRPGNGGTP